MNLDTIKLFTVLLYNHELGYLQVIAGGRGPEEAQKDAVHTAQLGDVVVVGVFAGVVRALTHAAALNPRTNLVVTMLARDIDHHLAHADMLEWTELGANHYAATVAAPEGLENTLSPETLTVYFEDGKWWLSQSDDHRQSDFLLLTEAIAAGNKAISEIAKSFEQQVPASRLQYLVGDILSLASYSNGGKDPAGTGTVEDRYLVAHLEHTRPDQSTDLLNWSVDGKLYTLRACGLVSFTVPDNVGPASAGSATVISTHGLTKEYLDALAAVSKIEGFRFDESAFFEWINRDGDPVGDMFDRISVDPEDEIRSLQQMLEPADTPMS